MRRTRILITLAGLAAILVTSGAYLRVPRARSHQRQPSGRPQTALADTTATLQETRVALAESIRDRVALADAAERLQQDKAGLQRDKSSLQADMNALTGYLNSELAKNGALTDDLEAAGVVHVQLRGEWVEAQSQITTLTDEKVDVEWRLDEMTQRFEARDADYTALYTQHQQLVQAVRAVEELTARATGLRTEIATLEERRQPLLLAMQRQRVEGFLCTGSMEPKLTCLDTATWMPDFSPEEIVVGTVISFDNRACWSDAVGGRSAHRVVATHIIDDVHYYWPKGDAHAHADGCWVPHTAVDGYLIELHRNTVTANAELRDNVNAANAAYSSAWEAYLDAIQAYCGHRNHTAMQRLHIQRTGTAGASSVAPSPGSLRPLHLLVQQRGGVPVSRPHPVHVLVGQTGVGFPTRSSLASRSTAAHPSRRPPHRTCFEDAVHSMRPHIAKRLNAAE